MAITLAGLQLLASLYRQGALAKCRSVIEIGSQDIHPKQDDVADLLAQLVGFRRSADVAITPAVLYGSLGVPVYRCIDADGRHDALTFDLNYDLATTYRFTDRFDVVTNHGTTEHVFDQCQVFQNIHDLCAPDGLMIHEVPFQKWINHGFYNYQPSFFLDLAAANDYRLIGLYLGLPTVGDLLPYGRDLADTLAATTVPLELLVVMRKTVNDQFRIPYNGKYLTTTTLQDAQYRAQGERLVLEQFFPGPRHPRGDTTSDINLMPTRRIAKALVRRLVQRIAGRSA